MYSTLYRVFSAPTNFTEANNQYRGIDGQVHATDGSFTYYTDFRYVRVRTIGDGLLYRWCFGEAVWRFIHSYMRVHRWG